MVLTQQPLVVSLQMVQTRLNGILSELIIIPSITSDTNRQKLEGYLAPQMGLNSQFTSRSPLQSNGTR